MVSDGWTEDDFRRETKVSHSPCPSPATGPNLPLANQPHPQDPQLGDQRKPGFPQIQRDTFQHGPVLVPLHVLSVVSVSDQGWGQHLWM